MSENYSIGDYQGEGRSRAIKYLLLAASIGVYVAGIIYAEVHGLNLLTKGVNPDFLLWAYVGMVALGTTALAAPAALHFWWHSPLQKILGLAFYVFDLSLLIFNAIGDYAVNTGSAAELPFWMATYLTYVVPATPILVALGWSLIWLVDPSSQERAMIEGLRASTRMALAARIAQAAKNTSVNERVDVAAANLVDDIVNATLGASLRKSAPKGVIEGSARDAVEAKRRRTFFTPGNGRVRAAKQTYEAEAENASVNPTP